MSERDATNNSHNSYSAYAPAPRSIDCGMYYIGTGKQYLVAGDHVSIVATQRFI
jgi:hypothetical protein